MCALAATQIAKFRDEQDFEDACIELWRDLLNDPNVQGNGRRGQRQNGVDIFGCRDRNPHQQVGVQCKLKGPTAQVTEKEVRHEVALARTFRPRLSEYVIATTAPDDQAIQQVARELTVEFASTEHPMTVAVWGWGTMERHIAKSPRGRRAFEPGHFPQGEQILALAEGASAENRANFTAVFERLDFIEAQVSVPAPQDADATAAVRLGVEAALDAQIDDLRDMGNAGRPRAALDQLTRLLARVRETASGRILFRITANIGVCRLGLGEDEEAADLLVAAYHHAPEEPKAVANRVLADLIRGDWQNALAFGREALAADPSNEAVASYVLQAASRDPNIAEPINLVPEALRSTASVMVAYAHSLWRPGSLDRWRQVARNAAAAYPGDEHAQQQAALADVDEVLSGDHFQKERILLDDERRQVERATAVLHGQWDAVRERDAPPRPEHLTLCGNLAAATFVLGHGEEALAIMRQGLALAPDDENLIARAASIAIEGVDMDYARELLPRLPATPEGAALRFRLHLEAGEWPELRNLSAHLGDLPPTEQTIGRIVSQVAGLATSGVPVAGADLAVVADEAKSDARASIVVATFALDQGLPEVSDKAFAAAVEVAQREGHAASRLTVAHHAERRGDSSVVADLLLSHVDESRDSADLRMLARALVNDLPIRQRALCFFERLPETVREVPSYLYGSGLMHLNRGALPEAEQALRRAVAAAPTWVDPNLALVRVLHRLRRQQESRMHLDGLDLAATEGTPAKRMELAQALQAFGLGSKALAYGYDVLQSARNDPTVATRYVGLVLVPDDGSIPTTHAVAPDTWFSMADGAGTTLSYLIEGQEDRPAEGVLSPSHPTAATAMGRKIGEIFTLPSSNRTWRIVEVKHKFLHAAHEVMESFEEDFPDASGFRRVSLSDGDIQPALDEVRRTSEALRDRANLYLDHHLPLAMVATHMGHDAIGLADYVRWLGRDVRACAGDLPEREAALKLIAKQRASGAVLDAYTAWTAATMDALDVLATVFSSLQIPRSALDELLMMRERLGPPGADGPMLTMAWRDGQYYREELSAEEVRARQALVEEQIAKVEAHCEIVPNVAPDEPSELARTITDVFDGSTLDAANLAGRERILVSEDQSYRATAEMATGTRGVWLQATFMFAANTRLINAERYDDLTVGLAARRHSHVAIEARSLMRAAEQDGAGERWRFDALAEYIGTPDAETHSHVNVVRAFLAVAWPRKGEAPLPIMSATGRLFAKLLRCSKGEEVALLALIRAGTGAALRRYVDGWIRGHFYSLDDVVALEARIRSDVQKRMQRPRQSSELRNKTKGRSRGKRRR